MLVVESKSFRRHDATMASGNGWRNACILQLRVIKEKELHEFLAVGRMELSLT
jgi:hypothetical protein